MAKTFTTLQTDLAYRLGESAAPTSSTELAKRRNWMLRALEDLASKGPNFWWQLIKYRDVSIDDQPYYTYPDGCLSIEQVKVDDWEYKKVPFDKVYERYETPLKPVPILPRFQLDKIFYIRNNKFYPSPKPDAPTTFTISSLTQTGGTATATTSSAHGYKIGDYVVVAGANQTEYNGESEVLSVPSTTTFTFSVSSGATSPATGTITVYRNNIEIWGYDDFATEIAAATDSSGIVIPDNFSDILVAYAEGRFWSVAHKRGKASDAFAEYNEKLDDMKKENTRRKFGEE